MVVLVIWGTGNRIYNIHTISLAGSNNHTVSAGKSFFTVNSKYTFLVKKDGYDSN